MSADVLLGKGDELLVAPVAPSESDQPETGWKQSPVGQVIDGWQELFLGQIAGDAEDDQRAGSRDARHAQIARIQQGIAPGRLPGAVLIGRSGPVGGAHK